MTILQIQYFLEIARCKNISEAARNLYITQPTLGRQISNMEKELNMQLMIRSNQGIRLTPAGLALQNQFSHLMEVYREGIQQAEAASRGFSGKLSIGVLDGLKIDGIIPTMFEYFENHYPNIEIQVHRMSFGELLDGVLHHELDAAISLDVNFPEHSKLRVQNIKPYEAAFVVPRRHPLAKKERLDFADFQGVPMAIVDRDDCSYGVEHLRELFYKNAGFYPNFEFFSSMKDVLLWIESGAKCAILNLEMQIVDSALVKVYPFRAEEDTNIQIASLRENHNIALQLLYEYYF